MDPAVRSDLREQTIRISRFQLGIFAEVDHFSDDRMFAAQGFQYLDIGGISALRLFPGWEFQFLEQEFAQLFRGIDIELFSGKLIDLVLKL